MKSLFQSKTFWTAIAIGGLSAAVEPMQVFISEHPGMSGILMSAIMIGLRVATTGSVDFSNPSNKK
jgi:hypothetical protein